MFQPPPPVPIHPGFISGVAYWANRALTAATAAVPAADVLYGYAFRPGLPVAISALQTRCASGGGVSSFNKVGVWRMSKGLPYGLPIVADNTGMVTSVNTTQDHVLADGQLPDEVMFWASVYTGSLPTMVHANGTNAESVLMTGTSALTNGAHSAGRSTPFAYSGDIRALNLDGAVWSFAPTGVPLLAFIPV